VEVKSRRSFLGCECIGPLSLGSHCAGWVDVAGAQGPAFVRLERDATQFGR
jgi:hypothetical protein